MDVLDQVQRIIGNRTNVLVIEDSLHKYNMVLENIEMYHRFVPVGGIMLGECLSLMTHSSLGILPRITRIIFPPMTHLLPPLLMSIPCVPSARHQDGSLLQ